MAHQRPVTLGQWANRTGQVIALSLALVGGLTACSSDEEIPSEVVTTSNGEFQDGAPLEVTPSSDSVTKEADTSVAASASSSDAAVTTMTEAPGSEFINPATDTVKAELTDNVTPSADVSVVADSVSSEGPSMFDGGTQPVAAEDIQTVSSPGVAQNLPDKRHRKRGFKKPKQVAAETTEIPSTKSEVKKSDMSQYVIEPGDTLATISQKIYGTVKFWQDLAETNGLTDANRIFAGDVIKFDARADKAKSFVKNYRTTMKSVVVKKGDSLSKIASVTYGTPDAWQRLLSFNRDKIKDPNHIPVGLKLEYMEGGKFAALPKVPSPLVAPLKSILLRGKTKSAPTHH